MDIKRAQNFITMKMALLSIQDTLKMGSEMADLLSTIEIVIGPLREKETGRMGRDMDAELNTIKTQN